MIAMKFHYPNRSFSFEYLMRFLLLVQYVGLCSMVVGLLNDIHVSIVENEKPILRERPIILVILIIVNMNFESYIYMGDGMLHIHSMPFVEY